MAKDKKTKAQPVTLDPDRAPEPEDRGTEASATVSQHAFRTGNRIKRSLHNPGALKAEGPLHAAADVLHGWGWHQHHYAAPVRMAEKDYLAAIKAAGAFKTHEAAMAPHWADEMAAREKAKESKA